MLFVILTSWKHIDLAEGTFIFSPPLFPSYYSKRILAMVQAPPQKPQDPKSKKGKDSTKNAEDEPVVSTRELHLHKQIRLFASRFLQVRTTSLVVAFNALPD